MSKSLFFTSLCFRWNSFILLWLFCFLNENIQKCKENRNKNNENKEVNISMLQKSGFLWIFGQNRKKHIFWGRTFFEWKVEQEPLSEKRIGINGHWPLVWASNSFLNHLLWLRYHSVPIPVLFLGHCKLENTNRRIFYEFKLPAMMQDCVHHKTSGPTAVRYWIYSGAIICTTNI